MQRPKIACMLNDSVYGKIILITFEGLLFIPMQEEPEDGLSSISVIR